MLYTKDIKKDGIGTVRLTIRCLSIPGNAPDMWTVMVEVKRPKGRDFRDIIAPVRERSGYWSATRKVNARQMMIQEAVAPYVTPEEINEAVLEAWEKQKPQPNTYQFREP